MKQPLRKHLDHMPPHWLEEESTYFITLCGEPRKLNQFCLPSLGPEIIQSVCQYNEQKRWFCHLVVLMPDHIHLLLSFPDISSFARVIGEWKKWLVKRHGFSFQENFFDHRLRREESLGEKADYMLHNPVRAGLVKEARDWPYQWMSKAD